MRRSIALFCVACLLPVVVLGSAFWIMMLRSQQAAIEQLAADHAAFAAALVGRELAAETRSVQMIGQSPAFDRDFDARRFGMLAGRLVAEEPMWRALTVSDPSGRRILDVPTPIAGMAGGKVVEPESLEAVIAGRRPVVGGVRLGQGGRAAFAVRAPVVRDGHVAYVVSAVVRPHGLARLLLAEGLPGGWTAEVIDGAGRVVTGAGPAAAAPASPAAASDLAARAIAASGSYHDRSHGPGRGIAAFRRVPGSDWTVHVKVPAAIYAAPGRQGAVVLAAGAAVSLALSGFLALLLLRDVRQRRAIEVDAAEHQRLEALGRMTGGVAHDFNNLLTPIIGGLDLLLRRTQADPNSQRLVEGALQSAERARELVSRLLSFARRQALEPRDVDVGRLIGGLRDILQGSLGPNVRLAVSVAPGLPSARVDPAQLELAILNLALNGRDAMPGGGLLTISADLAIGGEGTAARLAPERFVRIAIADAGSGMDAATLQRAIEPFFTTKPVGKGTGLGLSMVHGLAAQSGGALILSSTPGVGTTAEIWLPAGAARAAPREEAAEPISARTGVLLLVDDDDAVRRATADLLVEHGHKVLEAGSVSAALQLLRRHDEIEAVITDYAMPVGSGADVIAEARALRPGLPTLLVTGYAGAAERVPADVPRLEKPFRRTELLNSVGALLGQERPAIADLQPR